jgi:hypothetical protein
MGEFWEFTKSVINHWQTLGTGGIITFLILWWEKYYKSLSKRIFALVFGGLFLFLSCFLAWRDQHRYIQDIIKEKTKSDTTFENFRLEQRAWVGTIEVLPPEYVEGDKKVYVKERQQVKGGVFITNSGKTPARKLYTVVSMYVLKSGVEPIFQYKVVGTVQPSVTASKPTHGVMQPGMKFTLRPLPIEGLASKADIDDLINERYIVYLSGTITYEDVFEKSHETRFCLYLKPDLATFSACSTNNEAN